MKKRIRAAFMSVVLLVSVSVCVPHADAAGTVAVSEVSGAAGELAEVDIVLTSDDVCSGNFNICFDRTALELVDAVSNSDFHCLTNPLPDGTVRVSFMRLTPITDACLCTLTFRITADTSTEGAAVTLEQVKLYDENSTKVSASVVQGSVARKVVRLSMSAVDTAEYQAVRAIVELGGTLSPAGGNFSISYDPDCVEVKSVQPMEAMGKATCQYNVVEPGLVRISFGGTTALNAGALCAVVFQTVGSAGASSELIITDARMYDEESKALDVVVTNSCVDIVLPTDDAPKLWVVGGALQEDGSAETAVVLQGRGVACGGNFTLSYDKNMTASVQASQDCQIKQEAGEIKVSWASATAYSGEVPLISITFAGAVESAVTINDVVLYQVESEVIPVVEVRPGKISAGESVTATIGEVAVETTGTTSTYSVSIDVADINYFTDAAVESVTPVLALYEDGRMVGLAMQTITGSGSGVNEITLTADADRSVSDISVFVLEGVSMLPLTDELGMEASEIS